MIEPCIFALDFDGVLCDSALETGLAGWKAAVQLWEDMPKDSANEEIINTFPQVRPVIETGFESIFAIRLLYQQNSVETILREFSEKKILLLQDLNVSTNELKKMFGNIRDAWINKSLDEWLAKNPLYPGIKQMLCGMHKENNWYVVTTKQERFVEHILKTNGIELHETRIFGMDKKMDKESVLAFLLKQHPNQQLVFVEDRLQTLINVSKNGQLSHVKLMFADWGYNTASDIASANTHQIPTIGLEEFIRIVNQ